MTIQWTGDDEIRRNMDEYERRAMNAVKEVVKLMAPIIETYAKTNAPWTDRTSLARDGLRGYTSEEPADGYPTEELAAEVVALYLSHQMDYGAFLELAHGARWAVILPTLEAHYGQIKAMLDGIFT
ncbi:MAG: HK97 gp10 family phage protein [Hyphomicrobiaceae bacterium]|nr:MAG: HK97 gp10 family phage protein [Hyphomicrobiaceae bacterium]